MPYKTICGVLQFKIQYITNLHLFEMIKHALLEKQNCKEKKSLPSLSRTKNSWNDGFTTSLLSSHHCMFPISVW